MKLIKYLGLFMLIAALVVGCGKSSDQKEIEQATKKMEQATKKMEEAAKDMAEGLKEGGENLSESMKQMGEALAGKVKVDVVDFRELKKVLPDKLRGMKRVSAVGEKTGMFGIKVSEAKAEYESNDGASIVIRITDLGGMKHAAAVAKLGWTMGEIDRETDTGYERTFKYKGHPAREKYDNQAKDGQVEVFIAGRFVVEIEGSDVSMKELKRALDEIDTRKLEKMKDYGVHEK